MFDLKNLFANIGRGQKPFGQNPMQDLFANRGQNGWGATVDDGGWFKKNANDGSFAGLSQFGSDSLKGIGKSMQGLGEGVNAAQGGSPMGMPQMPMEGPQPNQQAMMMANPAAAFNAGQNMPQSKQISAAGGESQGMQRRAAFEDPRLRRGWGRV